MAKAKPTANVLGLVESDSEEHLAACASRPRGQQSRWQAQKRGRAPENKVTKPAQKATRRTNAKVAAAIEEEGARQALVDKSNAQPTTTAKRGRKGAAVKEVIEVIGGYRGVGSIFRQRRAEGSAPRAARPKGSKAAQPDPVKEIPDSAGPEQLPVAAKRRGPQAGCGETAEVVHDETEISRDTRADPMDVDEAEDVQLESPPAVRRMEPASVRRHLASPCTATSRCPRPRPERHRPSAPSWRSHQKVRDMESKYHDLKEIGIKEAERNFDRLKKLERKRLNVSVVGHGRQTKV